MTRRSAGRRTDRCIPVMHWLLQLCRTSSGAVDETVLEILRAAHELRCRVELLPVHRGGTEQRPFVTTIEELGEGGFVVALPTLGGVVRPLGRFESYQLSIEHPQKVYSGSTGSLGRMRFRSSARATQSGYRLTYPESLKATERRRDVRKVLGADTLREASIQIAHRKGPMLGLVEDISARGIRVRCRNGAADIRDGAQGLLRLELAEPIGEIAEMIRIVGVESDEQSGDMVLRAIFIHPVEAIAKVLDGACSAIRRAPDERRGAR